MSTITADAAQQLAEEGYCVVKDAVEPGIIAALDRDLAGTFAQTPFCQGGFYGARTKRFGRLLVRSPLARRLVQQPQVLDIVTRILSPWCDTIQLNLTQAIALHPGAPAQLPHRDQDMWRGETGRIEYLVNVMWPFTPYTAQNGATLIWPRSHGENALGGPAHAIADGGEAIALEPGSALLFLGSTLHGAGANRSTEVRRGAIVSYCLGWLKPYENQWLAYPPQVARTFPPDLAALVGYRQHRPNLGNFEGRCPSILFDEDREEHLAAIDALRPDQEEMLEAFMEGRQRAPTGQRGAGV